MNSEDNLSVHDWLTPYTHHAVELREEAQALEFFYWLRGGPEHRRCQVKELKVGRTVTVPTLVGILMRCQALTSLEIQFPYYLRNDPEANPLRNHLDNLTDLTHMYTNLVAYSEFPAFRLPDFEVFRRLTHLHLSPRPSGLPWKGCPIGFAELPRLTHLSLPFSVFTEKRPCALAVRAFLERESTQVVIFWLARWEFGTVIERALRDAGIGGRRIVIFYHWARESYDLLEEGGFWGRAKKVVAWREQNPDDPLANSEWIVNSTPWNHHVPAC